MTTICFLNPVGTLGGAERVLLMTVDAIRNAMPNVRLHAILLGDGLLCDELKRRGVVVDVILLPKALASVGDSRLLSPRTKSSWERYCGFLIKAFGKLRLALSLLRACPEWWSFTRKINKVFRRVSPSLLYSNGLKTHFVAAWCGGRDIKTIWHLHDFYSVRPMVSRCLRLIVHRVHRGIAISQAVATDTQKLFPKLPISTVLNAVDTMHFCPGIADDTVLDKFAGLEATGESVVRVGLVSTYANWKGQDVFIEALAILQSKGSNAKIRGYVIGGPIYATAGSQFSAEELAHKIAQHGLMKSVGLVPFQDDPVDVYRMLDIVVHASRRPEPFGLTIVEAMSCGRSVIVSDAGGASELFTDGYDALGHSPGNAVELASAIEKLATDADLRSEIGLRAREAVSVRFGQARYQEEVVQVVGDVLRSNSPKRAQ